MVKQGKLLRLMKENSSVCDLFATLKDWSKQDLEELESEIARFYEAGKKSIDHEYKQLVFRSEFFLSKRNSKQLDEANERAHINLLAICSEISSVAQFYLARVQ